MKLLLVAGKNIVLVVYNRLLKITHFVIITEKILAKECYMLKYVSMAMLLQYL